MSILVLRIAAIKLTAIAHPPVKTVANTTTNNEHPTMHLVQFLVLLEWNCLFVPPYSHPLSHKAQSES
jgi:hypothetical protein